MLDRVILLSSLLEPLSASWAASASILNDNLLVGPVAEDPRQHRALRAEYWGGVAPWYDAEEADHATIWSLRDWRSTVQLWQIAHHACSVGSSISVGFLGELPEVQVDGQDVLGAASTALRVPSGEPPRASPVDAETLRTWAALWKAFSGDQPQSFADVLSAPGDHAVPGLLTYYAGFFPRVEGEDILISRFDELLLGTVEDVWITPARVFAKALRAGSRLKTWIDVTGDGLIARRLQEWAASAAGHIECRREHDDEDRPMTAFAYRARGPHPEVLRIGVAMPPRIFIGGCVAYSRGRLWASRRGGGPTIQFAVHS